MPQNPPTLHLVCGLAGAGKSTFCNRLAQEPHTILISEDEWLSELFADQMATLADYVRCAGKLRRVVAPHVIDLLDQGLSVVLDFPANTRDTRHWMRDLVKASSAPHKLHVLDVPLEVCRARIHARNASGEHPFAVTDEQFNRLAKHFAPPEDDEGFTIVHHAFEHL